MSEQTYQQIRWNEGSKLIGKHHAVGVAVEYYTQIGACFLHFLLQLNDVFHVERIGLVVRKAAIRLIKQIGGVCSENVFHHD
ncbi:hypothetical protein DSECCO2_587490 [anaerobic digester metagenome]